jgi:glutathione S-transferase
MPSYTLTYYPMGGRAAIARLAFTIGGQEFKDERFTGEQLDEAFAKYPERFPKETVPALTIYDDEGKISHVINQSTAISAYAARVSGLWPEDAKLGSICDEITAEGFDLWDGVKGGSASFSMEGEAQKVERQRWQEETLKPILARIKTLAAGAEKTGFALGGEKPTYADLVIFTTVATVSSGFLDHVDKDAAAAYPNLAKVAGSVAALPAVQKFLAAHPGM